MPLNYKLEITYISCVLALDVVWRACRQQWIGRREERVSRKSVFSARLVMGIIHFRSKIDFLAVGFCNVITATANEYICRAVTSPE